MAETAPIAELAPAPRKSPEHAPMVQFPLRDGQLVVGGELLTTLAARVGHTPFYAYDRGLLRRRVAELRAAVDEFPHEIGSSSMLDMIIEVEGLGR